MELIEKSEKKLTQRILNFKTNKKNYLFLSEKENDNRKNN